jgi:type III secretion protein R
MTGRVAFFTALGVVCLVPAGALAAEGVTSRPVSVLLLLAGLSLLPFVLVMITSFVKISVVLSILRSAIGTPQVPPAIVLTGLAVILTAYVMAPTGQKVYQAVVAEGGGRKGGDLLSFESARDLYRAADRAKEPIRDFMVEHVRDGDRAAFLDLAQRMLPDEQRRSVKDRDLLVVVPAFVVGQLTAAFQIGFLLFVPFLVIDMVVANVLLALGMHMLSPTTVSLPFKLLLFVLVDGWALLTQGLVLSYL